MKLIRRVAAVATASAFRHAGRGPEDGPNPAPSRSRALVAAAPPQPAPESATPRPGLFAPFLAHIIAMRQQAAHLRQRRRAEPSVAVSRYAATARADSATGRHRLNRSA